MSVEKEICSYCGDPVGLDWVKCDGQTMHYSKIRCAENLKKKLASVKEDIINALKKLPGSNGRRAEQIIRGMP